jgi:alkylation response protein AidB-like acyl-CoA dehydrogenase
MEYLRTLPGDDLRAILWRFSDRFDLQMLIQSSRSVARGVVARAVANGARNTHEWTEEKNNLLKAFDESGITSLFMDPEHGGYIEGPKNFALALAAFELSWVDAGAATGSLAGNLALEPIHERGTPEQRQQYMSGAVPPAPGDDRKQLRGAFGLTEPLPYVGTETGMLSGKVRIAEWNDGQEPVLQVEKRGRFITNMDFANFTCVAVESDDDRIKGSCMIILKDTDPGLYDRGAPTLKLVHQLSSTRDPIFSMKVPASRIIGGYKIENDQVIPNYSHGQVIEPVFKHTRVTVGLMSAAKLLSAIEPIIRYQRSRFRGGELDSSSPRYKLGIQQKEDALHRLLAIWAMGEAAASLGFAASRLFDELDPLEKEKNTIFKEKGVQPGRPELKAMAAVNKDAEKWIDEKGAYEPQKPVDDPLMHFSLVDSLANVLCPAVKLWNTGQSATMMREAVSLMGGYGITEDCPGFLGQKWMDTQLEATYEGPEVVQRRQLSFTLTHSVFLKQVHKWIDELEELAQKQPASGADLTASSLRLVLFTLEYMQSHKDADGGKLYSSSRQGVTFPIADAFCWALASRYQLDDIRELMDKGSENPALADGFEGTLNFYFDLCKIQAVRSAGEVIRLCSEIFYGVADPDKSDRETFARLRQSVDEKQGGLRQARDRASQSLVQVMIPEALDYPL